LPSVQEILPGVFHWTATHPRIGIRVSSYWLEQGGVLLDPLVPPDVGIEWFAEREPTPTAVILTNRHHYRQSDVFAERFAARVLCVSAGMHEFAHGRSVAPFDFGDQLPGDLKAVEIDAICPDDTALYSATGRWVAFADGLVRGGPHGQPNKLGFVPDGLMDDPPKTKRALLASFRRVIDELEFEHVLLAHGEPLVGDGRDALSELVQAGGRAAFEF
jgi:hypothetical protein